MVDRDKLFTKPQGGKRKELKRLTKPLKLSLFPNGLLCMYLSQNVATVEANLLVSHASSCLKFHLIYGRSCFAQGLDVVAKSAKLSSTCYSAC